MNKIIYLLLILLNNVLAIELLKPHPLSILWKLDSRYRSKFGRRYKININEDGLSQLTPIYDNIPLYSIPSNQLNDIYLQLCDDENNDNNIKKEFLQKLNQSEIFLKMNQIYQENNPNRMPTFLEHVEKILFLPEENPSFYSLFCHFTSQKGIWLSLVRDQSKLKIVSMKQFNNKELIKDVQVKLLENGIIRKRRVLMETSLEFEIASLVLCVIENNKEKLWRHCSAPIDVEYNYEMAVQLSDDSRNIKSFYTRIVKKTKKKHKNDPEFQKLVDQLWEKDVDRIDQSAITLNWQGKLEKKQVKDISPDPLISHLDESVLQKPIYAALIEMYKQKPFYEQVCEAEPIMNDKRREKFAKIWSLITETEIFKLGYEFLKKHGKTKLEFDVFREAMFDLWFGTYSRCEANQNTEPLGSSGFEHVFSGEWRQGTVVEGHHNWLRYYLQEKAGDINYYGYFEHQVDNIIGTFQYKWKGFLKRIGGFFFRTSPAFDFTLFTVCALAHPGNEACHFELLNTKMFVTTFKNHCNNGTCLATSYPGLY